MSADQKLKDNLHQIIDQVEDVRILEAVYTILEKELQKEISIELSDSQRQLLDERLSSYKNNFSIGDSWESVKARIKKQL